MRNILTVLPFTAMTFLCWGVYGPVLHHGSAHMGSSMRQLICVGLAYFLIAVIVPVLLLRSGSDSGRWTVGGTIWSLAAGACGALGALGIITALSHGGKAVYVMPLVFGGAPVVNTVIAMAVAGTFRKAGKLFYLGIVLVAFGGGGVMYFQKARPAEIGFLDLDMTTRLIVAGSIALTAFCWGGYGNVLHTGQARMGGSRLRPFLCVGLAYFLIAVLVPLGVLATSPPATEWHWDGALWSLAGGAAGALGALGIILSFTFGGKPIYVMPLVFGGAPVVNTAVTVLENRSWSELSPYFYGSLTTVVLGAVLVLVFSPKPTPKKAPAAGSEKTPQPLPPPKPAPATSDEF